MSENNYSKTNSQPSNIQKKCFGGVYFTNEQQFAQNRILVFPNTLPTQVKQLVETYSSTQKEKNKYLLSVVKENIRAIIPEDYFRHDKVSYFSAMRFCATAQTTNKLLKKKQIELRNQELDGFVSFLHTQQVPVAEALPRIMYYGASLRKNGVKEWFN